MKEAWQPYQALIGNTLPWFKSQASCFFRVPVPLFENRPSATERTPSAGDRPAAHFWVSAFVDQLHAGWVSSQADSRAPFRCEWAAAIDGGFLDTWHCRGSLGDRQDRIGGGHRHGSPSVRRVPTRNRRMAACRARLRSRERPTAY